MKKLNLDTISELYEFGALLVYEVIFFFFDKVTFTTKIHIHTFSEDEAKKYFKQLTEFGSIAQVESYFVNFNGAYSV